MKTRSTLLIALLIPSVYTAEVHAFEKTDRSLRLHSRDDVINKTLGDFYTHINGYDCYRTMQSCQDTMADIALQNPFFSEVTKIGSSWKGSNDEIVDYDSDINALLLTNQFSTKAKYPVFIICNMIPTELSPPEVCARFAEKIIQEKDSNGDFDWMLDYAEIHMVFQANPDGRYFQEQNLNTRIYKNLHEEQICSGSSTDQIGTNINRNFPHSSWSNGETKRCSIHHRGTSSNSEPETNAIINYITLVMDGFPSNQKGVLLDLHSTGQQIMWPLLSSITPNINTISDNEAHLATAKKMAGLTNPIFFSDNERKRIRTGTVVDWAYDELNLASFLLQIGTRDDEPCDGFDQLFGNAENLILYAIRVGKDPHSLPLGPEIRLMNPLEFYPQDPFFRIQVEIVDTEDVITKISVYIDKHPYQTGAFPNLVVDTGFTSSTEIVLLTLQSSLAIGPHIAYFQAEDMNGPGPVYAHSFTVTSFATFPPTVSPTSSPTVAPATSQPTPSPITPRPIPLPTTKAPSPMPISPRPTPTPVFPVVITNQSLPPILLEDDDLVQGSGCRRNNLSSLLFFRKKILKIGGQ